MDVGTEQVEAQAGQGRPPVYQAAPLLCILWEQNKEGEAGARSRFFQRNSIKPVQFSADDFGRHVSESTASIKAKCKL